MSQSKVALVSDVSSSALPFHVLMVPSPDQQLQRRRLFEQRLEKDYISRRYKTLHDNDTPPIQDKNANASTDNENVSEQQQQQPAMDVWRGTSEVERSLVECCEVPASWEEASNGGALAKGKEIAFLGILASCCNDVGTRALALAILERTIRKDEKELEDDQQPRYDDGDKEYDDSDEAEDDLSNENQNCRESELKTDDTVQKEGGDNNEGGDLQAIDSSVESISQQNKDDHPPKGSEPNDTTEDGQSLSREIPRNAPEAENEKETVKRSARNTRQEEAGRMDVFLAAGGLSLLNHWFKDAISPVVVAPRASFVTSQAAASKKPPSSPKPTRKPAPTGPVLLVLLSILEKIPFDKKLVMETKINKQIRKLSKHVDSILKSEEPSPDLTDPVAGGLSVVNVKKAVDALKETWEAQASEKNKNATVHDPFAELKKKMKERLEILQRYEAGELPKPDWLARFDQLDKSDENVSKKRKAKTSMTVLQARERQQECMALTKKLKEAQREKVKLLNQLRERRKKAEDEAEKLPARKTTKAKKVTWKDGLSISTGIKVHRLLEQVHHYDPYEFDDEDEDGAHMEDMNLHNQDEEFEEAEDEGQVPFPPLQDPGDETVAVEDDRMDEDSSDQEMF